MRSACIFLWLSCTPGALLLAQGDAFEKRVELLFRPPLAEQMALSPDGRHVAYTVTAGKELHVVIFDVEAPRQRVTLNVDEARVVLFSKEKQRAQLRFLRWATADRLVLAPTEEVIPLPNGPKINAPIMAVDVDGQNPTTLIDTETVTPDLPPVVDEFDTDEPAALRPPAAVRSQSPALLGFASGDRGKIIVRVAAAGPFLPPDLISLDVRTGERTYLHGSRPPVDGAADGRLPLAFSARSEVIKDLAGKFPHRKLMLIDWTADAQHVLVRVSGGSDPGRVFVYQRPQNLVLEIFRNAPWLNSATLNEARFVESGPAAPGPRLTGYVTWPRTARLKPPPLLVCLPSGFPGRLQPDFDPEAQVFADLGFVVLRLNHRYANGVPPAEREALRTGLDRLPVDDAAGMIKELAAQFPEHPFDARHVAVLGRGFGGYLAVRALQLRPDVFRAGLAIDAPMDLRRWLFPASFFLEAPAPTDLPRGLFDPDSAELQNASVSGRVETLTRPICFLVEPGRNAAIEIGLGAVRSQLKSLKRPADYLELDPGFALELPAARAAAYRKIEEFLNLRLYDYRVKIGPTTEVK